MKKVLVLGAGLVAEPHVRYLLDNGFQVTVASRTLSKAEHIIGDHANGVAIAFDITKEAERLPELISKIDLAVSLLPYTYHVRVAKECIKQKKQMVTTSYVSAAMKELDAAAKEAGVILLNEIGVDPGIDHMSAQQIIDDVHEKGGKIMSFRSICGGLPAPDANDNPFGYKFSWSPRGVLLAGRNDGKYLEDGKIVEIQGGELFDCTYDYEVEGLGDFEVYPNRDSIPYVETYQIEETKTMFRGTIRNLGWCKTLKKIAEIGYLDLDEKEIPAGTTYAKFIQDFASLPTDKPVREAIAVKLDIPVDSDILDRFEWAGLLGDDKIPFEKSSPLDVLVERFNRLMKYAEGERDMLILAHEFIAEFPDRTEKITSTMIDYGIPHGHSSMSRTVGLPAAIGARMILEGTIKDTGVFIPVAKTIYEPILNELANMNISFVEKRTRLD